MTTPSNISLTFCGLFLQDFRLRLPGMIESTKNYELLVAQAVHVDIPNAAG